MGEAKHDYVVLAVVAVVAVAAVVSMGLSFLSDQDVSETRDFVPVTGMVTTQYSEVVQGVSRDFDFSEDTRLTREDSYLLAEYIYSQDCPLTKACDVNGDGALDMRDLELFNSLIESPATARVRESNSLSARQKQSRTPSVGARLA